MADDEPDPDGTARDEALTAIADELYGLPPGAFTAAREDRAKAARADDRELAARIHALPKPIAAAWVVDLLVRQRADRVDELLELGATLRAAQEELDAPALRELAGQRRRVVAAVVDDARDLAAAAGEHPGPAVLEAVGATLTAALVDAAAGEAVRTGRLVRPLAAAGLDAVDLTDAVAPFGASPRIRTATAEKTSDPERDRAVETARSDAARAADAASGARGAADAASAAVERAQQQVDERTAAVDALQQELEALRRRLHDAEQALGDAEDALTRARRTARAAARDADDAAAAAAAARDRLERLSER